MNIQPTCDECLTTPMSDADDDYDCVGDPPRYVRTNRRVCQACIDELASEAAAEAGRHAIACRECHGAGCRHCDNGAAYCDQRGCFDMATVQHDFDEGGPSDCVLCAACDGKRIAYRAEQAAREEI